jgi:hypothetical protein
MSNLLLFQFTENRFLQVDEVLAPENSYTHQHQIVIVQEEALP